MMSRSVCRIATGLLLTLTVGCDAAETDQGNCRRFLKIYDDLKKGTGAEAGQPGTIGSDAELKERLEKDIGSFKEGSSLRQTFDSLIAAIESVDTNRAATETNRLVEQCSEIAD